ncbi:dnaJ domain protein [Sphingomonas sp. S17]|uniref:DnaJ domain-containing protein n=2 Tax=Sphingomonas paucimobilis TaxID=13689 RepID=A0A411LJQ3_SPHPI|nr:MULTISPECIES: DnaJ domain-containing protein [Sphingomonas]EGI56635.1 dnaJ domain protein [Sphingomonas sp. S17]MBQ1479159.1 DnaJ domain-containing protein [Sphingomonas sp.]MCM3678652.1 DnaJ domain-containing protein [Sphingomonas paucimobilis]MDG5969680.1 DnaJ domain-containing protein [Sphingomonas paucimobilis]NNG59592.1 DnaJ domain-containing protein [Sphingomonas paucimobilis]
MKWLLALLVIWLVWRYLPRPRKAALQPRLPQDEAEALAILDLPPGADAEAIRQAHRRLVGQVHPDRGGSADLTRRVNAARNLLLDRRNG